MRSFKKWYDATLAEYSEDIANYGCDGGFPGITYTSDCVKIYDIFETEIYEALLEDAEDFGYSNIEEMISKFNQSDMLTSPKGRKNLLVWYMVEREAHRRAI